MKTGQIVQSVPEKRFARFVYQDTTETPLSVAFILSCPPNPPTHPCCAPPSLTSSLNRLTMSPFLPMILPTSWKNPWLNMATTEVGFSWKLIRNFPKVQRSGTGVDADVFLKSNCTQTLFLWESMQLGDIIFWAQRKVVLNSLPDPAWISLF